MRQAPHNGTETSREAALEIRKALPKLEGRVLIFIAGRPDGATNEEIETALQMTGNTVRPRVVELRERKLIHDSGQTRKTRSGRNAIVWERT
jgi:transcription initiation factor IIE alpha subunit